MKLTREQRQQIVDNVRGRRATGTWSHRDVCAIAADAGVTVDYIYQLARNGAGECNRQPWALSDAAIELYYRKRGCIPDVHAAMVAAGECPVGLRQLQRAFRDQLGSDERAFVRWGAARRQANSGTLLWNAPSRNAVWQTDHVQLGVPVLLPGHKKLIQLCMTYFIDCYSRMVMGWMISVRQSSDAVLEALRDSILRDPESGHPHGGKPSVIMYDNGLTFLAEVVQDAAAYLDFRTQPVAPYSPYQNGKVERCHQTLSRLALSEIASWDHGPRDKAGRLHDYTPIKEGELIRRVKDAVYVYNFERPHTALSGRTPWQSFVEDSTPLRLESPERLRFALRHRKIQKVSTKGVYKHDHWYRHGALDDRCGDHVIVAWLRYDHRSVDVYTREGAFLCTAYRQGEQGPQEIVAYNRDKRERATLQKARLAKSISDMVESYAPTNQPEGLQVVSGRAGVTGAGQQDSRAQERTLLEVLGLAGQVGSAWPPGRKADEP